MNVGQTWMNSSEKVKATIMAIEGKHVTVRFCDAGQASQNIAIDSFRDSWEKTPDFLTTGFTWLTETQRRPGIGGTYFQVMAGGRRYVALVSDDAIQAKGHPECKRIAQNKIADQPWAAQVEVRLADK